MYRLIFIILLFWASCKNETPILEFVEYYVSPCEGYCSSYDIRIESNGKLTYHCQLYTELDTGVYYSIIDSNKIKKIFESYRDVFKYKDEYFSSIHLEDGRCRFLKFKYNNKEKNIRDCLDENDRNNELDGIYYKIDSLIKYTKWIRVPQ